MAPRVAPTMAAVGGDVVCFWVEVDDAGGIDVAVAADVTVAVVSKVTVIREVCPSNRVVATVSTAIFVVIRVGSTPVAVLVA